MASAESTGKTVAIVILTVLLVVALSTAYYFYTKIQDAVTTADKARVEKKASDDEANKRRNEYQELASLIRGVAVANAEHAGLMEDSKKLLINPNVDDSRLVKEAPKARPAYDTFQAMIEFQNQAISTYNKEIKANDDQLKKTGASLKASTALGESKVAEVNTQFAAAKDEFGREIKLQKEQTEANRQTAESESKRAADFVSKSAVLQRELIKQKEKFESDMGFLRNAVEILKRKDATKAVTKFQHKDAEVTQVADGGSTVFVNVGRADGVTEGLTFGLYGRDEQGFINALPKSRVEIVQIVDAHRSKGKVHDYDITRPVVEKDQLFNPVWSPGEKLKVAFVGFVDLDGDGRYDNAEFERIVTAYGAQLVGRVNLKDGNAIGGVDATTQFLIEGEAEPEGKAIESEDAGLIRKKVAEAATAFREQARKFSVPRVDYKNFLHFMGYRTVRQVQQAGAEEDRVRKEIDARNARFRPLANEKAGDDQDVDTVKLDARLSGGKAPKPAPKKADDTPAGSTDAGMDDKPAAPKAPKKKSAKVDDDL